MDLGDLETSVEYEFLRERRYRPALNAEGAIKWPTATDPDLDTPGRDYSFGLIASKDFVYFDADLNVLYTFVGDAAEPDNLQVALAAEMALKPSLRSDRGSGDDAWKRRYPWSTGNDRRSRECERGHWREE